MLSPREIAEIVNQHNLHRKRFNVPDIAHDPLLSEYSQMRANTIAKSGQFKHSDDNPYGENLYASSDPDGSKCVSLWMSEENDWDPSKNNWLEAGAGHFSQCIWRSSLLLGIGKSRMANGMYVIVCNYNPAGNMIGQRPY